MKRKNVIILVLAVLLLISLLTACGSNVSFKIDFIVDGDVYHTVDSKGNEEIKMPPDPTKEGSIFDGWFWDEHTWRKPFTANSISDAPLSENMSVYAKWKTEGEDELLTFTITFNSNGGSDVYAITKEVEESVDKPTEPTKVGYSFDGWFIDNETFANEYIFSTMPAESFTLYAKWTINQYTISFNSNGGSDVVSITQDYNTEVLAPAEPIKGYYTFSGWFVDNETFENEYVFSIITAQDISLHAKWVPNKYPVSFFIWDETEEEYIEEANIEVPYGQQIIIPELLREGYSINNWYTDQEKTLEWNFNNPMPGDTVILYGNWTINQYTISFNSNGGSDVVSITQDYNTEILAPAEPTKGYYTFSGWFVDNETFENEYVFSIITAQDISLHAKWVPNKYPVSFFIWDETEEEYIEEANIEVPYGQQIIIPELLREGYSINNWYTDQEKTLEWNFNNPMPGYTVILYGNWTINQYTISFNSNGGSEVTAITQDYGTEVDEPAEPTKEGYTFDGWYTDNDTFVNEYIFSTIAADDTILYANWTINQYTISFNSNGGSAVVAITQDYGTEVSVPTAPTRDYYTFNGWYTDDGTFSNAYTFTTMPADNITVFAKWTINQYTISFNSNGGSEVTAITQDYGTEVDEPAEPTKEGYTFYGWYTDNDTFVNEYIFSTIAADDTILYANWTINQYTISFSSNGGSAVVAITQDYGTEVSVPTAPTRDYYTFNGWYTDDGTFSNAYTFTTMPADNITVFAKWTINQYTISFNSNGGSEVTAITQDYGTEVDEPAEPTKEGYTFDGWYTDNDTFVNEYIFSTIAADDTILYANWTINQYTISFNSNGGSAVVAITQDYGTEVSVPTAPTRDYYTFNGWYTDDGTLSTAYTFTTMPADNITVFAKWTINQYTISFNSNGGSEVTAITQDYGTEVDEPAKPTKEGYTFDGWYTDNDTFVNEYIFSTIAADDTILYANWTINQYTISFNSNGGSAVVAITQDYGTEVSVPTAPTRDYYTFNGWYTDDGTFSNAYTFTTMPADNITVFAKWTINQYTISFNSNGGSEVTAITQDYGTEVDEPTEPTKVGYSFDGWFIDNETFANEYIFSTMPAESFTLYAKWTIKQYTISFNSNGGSEVTAITQDYGTEVDEPAEPTKEGYTFYGWYTDNDTFVNEYIFSTIAADDTILYANWTINQYTISFSSNGGSAVVAITQDYGTEVSVPTAPTRDYYTFNGWYTDDGTFSNAYTFTTMPADNITVFAKWTINQYTISFNSNGGSNVQAITKEAGVSITAPTAPTRTGYTFGGWYTDNGTFENEYEFTVMPEESFTLFVLWKINKYTVTFDGNGGALTDGIVVQTIDHGSAAVAPSYTKEGYTFDGWSAEFDNITSNITIVAKWIAILLESRLEGLYNDNIQLYYYIQGEEEGSLVYRNSADYEALLQAVMEGGEDPIDNALFYMFNINNITGVITNSEEFMIPFAIEISGNISNVISDLNNSMYAAVMLQTDSILSHYAEDGNVLILKERCLPLILTGDAKLNNSEDTYVSLDGTVLIRYIGSASEYTIPTSVTSIGMHAFSGSGLTSIIFENTEGWYVGDTLINATDTFLNVEYLTGAYSGYTWYRQGGEEGPEGRLEGLYNDNIQLYYYIQGEEGGPLVYRNSADYEALLQAVMEGGEDPIDNALFYMFNINNITGVITNSEEFMIPFAIEISGNISNVISDLNNSMYAAVMLQTDSILSHYAEDGNVLILKERCLPLILTGNAKLNNSEDTYVSLDGTVLIRYIGSASEYTIPTSVTSIGMHAFSGSGLTSIIFENTEGWYVGDTLINATDTFLNVEYLTGAYSGYTWYRQGGEEGPEGRLEGLYNDNIQLYYYIQGEEESSLVYRNSADYEALLKIVLAQLLNLGEDDSALYAFFNTNKIAGVITSEDEFIPFAFEISGDINDAISELNSSMFFSLILAREGLSSIQSIYAVDGNILIIEENFFPLILTGNVKLNDSQDAYVSLDETVLIRYIGSTSAYTIPTIVTNIGDYAFNSCHGLTSITIHDGVTSIGSNAFSCCDNLNTINVSEDNMYYKSIDGVLFSKDGTKLIKSPENKNGAYTIPNGVTSIGDNAFDSCISITSITIPDSVTIIGNYAFHNCQYLTSINIPTSVTSIGSNAFSRCYNLSAINVSEDNMYYKSMDGVLFSKDGTKLIKSPENKNGAYTIPNGVTSIGDNAFDSCISITSITIPDSVTSIGAGAFMVCASLSSIIIPNSVKSIGVGAFVGCASLSSIIIPNTVTTIGAMAFMECTSLTIYAEASSKPNGWADMWNMGNLLVVWGYAGQAIDFDSNGGSSVTAITKEAGVSITAPTAPTRTGYTFDGWYTDNGTFLNGYTFSVMPAESVTLYAKWIYAQPSGSSALRELYEENIDLFIEVWGDFFEIADEGVFIDYYDSEDQLLTDFKETVNINSIESIILFPELGMPLAIQFSGAEEDFLMEIEELSDLQMLSDIYGYTIDENIIFFGLFSARYIFTGNAEINQDETAYIGQDGTVLIRYIGSDSAYSIGDGITNIGVSAFAMCEDLTSVSIPNSVTSIGAGAFMGCASLSSIIIPNTVTTIGAIAFMECTSLTIYAEASSKLDGWADMWNPDNRPVVWGYAGQAIDFNSNGGSNVQAITKEADVSITAPTAPTRTGYTFGGWYTDSGTFENEYEFTTMPEESFTLYAKWIWDGQNDYDTNGYYRVDNYIWFGEYPQTIKANDVTITETIDGRGYYLGSDGYYYAKVTATPYSSGYTFSTSATVSSGTVYYFKVEPIKWRILTESGGTALILCESIIANKRYAASSNNYMDSEIRAWLNGEFYNTAFTAMQQDLIEVTNVDNSVYSTGYDSNPYACANTNDKIFLPSYNEMVNTGYGFSSSHSTYDTARRRLTSDYSRATGVWVITDTTCYGNGYWWLRSPYYDFSDNARNVDYYGDIDNNGYVGSAGNGVVPALKIRLSTPQPNEYTISFDSNGGSNVSAITKEAGESITEPTAPTKTGYTFGGWYTDNGTFENAFEFDVMPAESFTLYAKWIEDEPQAQTEYTRINASGEPAVDGDYILFGEYPQTIKANEVTVGTSADTRGYYLGSDGYYYAKVMATPRSSGYTFSTSATVSSGTVYYFKVEPIKWRILSEENGTALILCESIIANKRYDDSSNNYMNSEIRAWLNGEFYNKAFTALQQELIQITNVDNSVYSTGYSSNPYTCANTNDKIFLPSYREMVNTAYGFSSNSSDAYDTARRRLTSDYSRATGVWMNTNTSYYGNGYWWLRSPGGYSSDGARYVFFDGDIYDGSNVNFTDDGVVPALVIDLR